MNFITTLTGRSYNLDDPRPSDIVLPDIAHALARINRYQGATIRAYSVAEHSLLVAEICERELQISIGTPACHGLLAALMHDAHECYVGDISTPVKRAIGGAWYPFERKHENAVRSAFALHVAARTHHEAIKRADLIALATERAQLMHPHAEPWVCLQGIEPVTWIDLLSRDRWDMKARDWQQAFADRVDELDYARNLHAGVAA